MKLAIFSDIHSNLEALEAAFEDLQSEQIDAIYCTGDLVGYASNPNEVIDLLRQNKVKCIMGNHDYACFNQRMQDNMLKNAYEAIVFTKWVLTQDSFSFLKDLPWQINENEIYLTHGLPPALLDEYIDMQSKHALIMAFSSFREQVSFVGHTHLFEVYELTEKGKLQKYEFPDSNLDLNPGSRYMISAGSVGQPRDDNREAGYLIYDTDNHRVTRCIIQYPVEITIQKIIAAGLPEKNGTRLRKD
jgi:predicted phosphodiesterase